MRHPTRLVRFAGLLTAALVVGCGESIGNESGNATLTGLTVSTGALNPFFSTSVYTYSVTVANSITSIIVTPTATDPNATIRVRGAVVPSGDPSPAQVLTVGPNLIDVAVTAQDGSLLIYDITVTRQ